LAPLERQVVVTRPLVPRAGVVAGSVAGGAERERRERGPRARVAIGDDVVRIADARTDLIGRKRLAGTCEQILDGHVACTWDPSLSRVARIAVLASELVLRAHVEDH